MCVIILTYMCIWMWFLFYTAYLFIAYHLQNESVLFYLIFNFKNLFKENVNWLKK